jgi:hypothetical protein
MGELSLFSGLSPENKIAGSPQTLRLGGENIFASGYKGRMLNN